MITLFAVILKAWIVEVAEIVSLASLPSTVCFYIQANEQEFKDVRRSFQPPAGIRNKGDIYDCFGERIAAASASQLGDRLI